jgi:hypothetical protein
MKIKCLFLLTLIVLQTISWAEDIILEDGKETYFISQFIEHLEDSTQLLSIEDISSPAYTHAFRKGNIPYYEKEYDKVYWIKFSVHNKRKKENQSWYFESWGFDIDHIEFYVPDREGKFFKTSMGYAEDFSNRNIYHKNFQFLINLNQNEKATYYIKLKRKYPMHLTFFVRTHEAFIKHAITEYWYLGIFYGIFVFVILINLYMYFSLKEKVHLYYVLLASSEVLYCLGRDGLGFQFLWPSFPSFNEITHHNYTQFFFIVFTLLYSISFLKLKNELNFMYRLTKTALIFKIITFSIFIFYQTEPHYIFTIDSLILLIPFISGILSVRKGNRYAKYYVAAFTFLFISFLLIFMEERRLLPYIVINWYFINIGMLLEVIFLAVALFDQIRILRAQNEKASKTIISELKEKELLKDKLNQELEKKVEERTKEIKEMLSTLEEKNSELHSANKELKFLTEKINQMNELLNQDNKNLQFNLTEINRSRILLKDVKFEEFRKAFPDDHSCLKFIAELKWNKGYQCRKCGFRKGTQSNKDYSIRCKGCKYNESPIAGTLLHKLKFPISKAFYMIYLINRKEKSLSLDELSGILELRRETCWSFRKKILKARENYNKNHSDLGDEGWASLIFFPSSDKDVSQNSYI